MRIHRLSRLACNDFKVLGPGSALSSGETNESDGRRSITQPSKSSRRMVDDWVALRSGIENRSSCFEEIFRCVEGCPRESEVVSSITDVLD